MSKRVNNLIMYSIIVVLVIAFVVLLISNDKYNKTLRIGEINESNFIEDHYDFDEISVKIGPRGGDSSSWLKDPIYDENDVLLHGPSVGTIYEALIINNSTEVVSDWKLKIMINEPMWINNSWNSKLEIHQNVQGNEIVQAIDLTDYSEYDIAFDYYTDHTGPMIGLYPGDYFIYLPEEIAEEKPIAASKKGEIGEATARFGYIMYIADQGVDYVADFSGGYIEYYMYRNPLKQTWFWFLLSLIFIWVVFYIITLVVQYKVKAIIKQREKEKQHDEEIVKQTMQLIINMIETKDTSTKGHSIRVAEYSKLIAEHMGLEEDDCQNVYYIGLLHDCGKVHIPDAILKNPGRLSDDEFSVMKKHTTYGANILKDFSSIRGIDIGAKYHHERYDGKGYPSGLSGEDIPMISRIIGVADAFDAMNSKRCYRDKLPSEIIIKELEENKGKQFDPVVVEHLLQLIHEGTINL